MMKSKKNIYIFLTLLPLLLIILFSKNLNNKSYYGLLIILDMIYTIFMAFLYFEKSKKGIQQIAIIATLSSFAAVSRVAFISIPNVQPATFIILLSGVIFGGYNGFLIGATTAFTSNIFLGQGPWTPWQMIAWGIIGLIGGLIGIKNKKPRLEVFIIVAFASGIIFGFIMNLWHVIGFIKEINKEAIILTYLNSIYYDVLHGIGNVIFGLIFYENFYKVLNRFYERTYYKEDN